MALIPSPVSIIIRSACLRLAADRWPPNEVVLARACWLCNEEVGFLMLPRSPGLSSVKGSTGEARSVIALFGVIINSDLRGLPGPGRLQKTLTRYCVESRSYPTIDVLADNFYAVCEEGKLRADYHFEGRLRGMYEMESVCTVL